MLLRLLLLILLVLGLLLLLLLTTSIALSGWLAFYRNGETKHTVHIPRRSIVKRQRQRFLYHTVANLQQNHLESENIARRSCHTHLFAPHAEALLVWRWFSRWRGRAAGVLTKKISKGKRNKQKIRELGWTANRLSGCIWHKAAGNPGNSLFWEFQGILVWWISGDKSREENLWNSAWNSWEFIELLFFFCKFPSLPRHGRGHREFPFRRRKIPSPKKNSRKFPFAKILHLHTPIQ